MIEMKNTRFEIPTFDLTGKVAMREISSAVGVTESVISWDTAWRWPSAHTAPRW